MLSRSFLSMSICSDTWVLPSVSPEDFPSATVSNWRCRDSELIFEVLRMSDYWLLSPKQGIYTHSRGDREGWMSWRMGRCTVKCCHWIQRGHRTLETLELTAATAFCTRFHQIRTNILAASTKWIKKKIKKPNQNKQTGEQIRSGNMA